MILRGKLDSPCEQKQKNKDSKFVCRFAKIKDTFCEKFAMGLNKLI